MFKPLRLFLLGAALVVGCSTSDPGEGFRSNGKPDGGGAPSLGGPDGAAGGGDARFGVGSDGAIAPGPGAEAGPSGCNPTSDDLHDCACPTAGATRACYTADPQTRNVGTCKDGMQTCTAAGEFATWGTCTGAVTPGMESCTGTVDSNCNGKVGCADPSCASDPACQTGCTDGQTRPCYDGPMGTENVGTCKDGTQTCANGQWPMACAGEVTPQPESCCDALDHNCNALPGCYDIFSCFANSCCQESCDATKTDPGCVCMVGAGDTATCPKGDHYVHTGGVPGTDECCPCAVSDCGNPNCCGEDLCAGNAWCQNLTCTTLPDSCNGQVSADCDDFPEDCDEPCCECNSC